MSQGEGVRKNLAGFGLVLDYYGERFEGVGFALNVAGKEAKLILFPSLRTLHSLL